MTPAAAFSHHGATLNHVGPAALAVAAVVVGYSLSDSYLILATRSCILGIAMLGLTLVFGWAREISLAHAGMTGAHIR